MHSSITVTKRGEFYYATCDKFPDIEAKGIDENDAVDKFIEMLPDFPPIITRQVFLEMPSDVVKEFTLQYTAGSC